MQHQKDIKTKSWVKPVSIVNLAWNEFITTKSSQVWLVGSGCDWQSFEYCRHHYRKEVTGYPYEGKKQEVSNAGLGQRAKGANLNLYITHWTCPRNCWRIGAYNPPKVGYEWMDFTPAFSQYSIPFPQHCISVSSGFLNMHVNVYDFQQSSCKYCFNDTRKLKLSLSRLSPDTIMWVVDFHSFPGGTCKGAIRHGIQIFSTTLAWSFVALYSRRCKSNCTLPVNVWLLIILAYGGRKHICASAYGTRKKRVYALN